MKTTNRVFATLFFVIVSLWAFWQPIKADIEGMIPIPWYHAYLIYATIMIGYPIILIGLAYEIRNPSLNLQLGRDRKWVSIGAFLLLTAAIIVSVDMFWKPYDPEYSLFGTMSFEFPRKSGQIYAWPNYLWEFLNTFCMETTSFSLLFGILFMTKSTPRHQRATG